MNKVRLRDLCKRNEVGKYGIPASAEVYEESKTRYLRISDIDDYGNLLSTDKKSVSSDDLEKYILTEGDIVFARTGNSTGRTYYHEEKNGRLAFAGFLIKYGLDPTKVVPKYLRYYTISNEYRQWVKNLSVGSTRGNMNAQTFADCPITLPTREQQELLVDTLSSIDSKISLNNHINAVLEAFAKSIYDYWFVQFDFPDRNGKPYKASGGKMVWSEELKREIPEGWKVNKLESLGSFRNGINYDASAGGDNEVKIINVRDVSKSDWIIPHHDLDTIKLDKKLTDNYLLEENDILITRSGIPGATRLIFEFRNTIYSGFIIKYHVNTALNRYLLFFGLKDLEASSTSKSAGTIMKNVSQDTLKGMLVVMPVDSITKSFNEKIAPIFKRIYLTINANKELTELRGWLLPMLINGQVKVA